MSSRTTLSLCAAVAAMLLASSIAIAQTTPAPAPTIPAPAISVPDVKTAPAKPMASTSTSVAEKPPLVGANSFTQAQVTERLQTAGYTGATGLKQDEKGIWRGTATKSGKSVGIAFDFKGNLVETP